MDVCFYFKIFQTVNFPVLPELADHRGMAKHLYSVETVLNYAKQFPSKLLFVFREKAVSDLKDGREHFVE